MVPGKVVAELLEADEVVSLGLRGLSLLLSVGTGCAAEGDKAQL